MSIENKSLYNNLRFGELIRSIDVEKADIEDLYLLGMTYYFIGRKSESLTVFIKASKEFSNLELELYEARVYNMIATLYNEVNYDNADDIAYKFYRKLLYREVCSGGALYNAQLKCEIAYALHKMGVLGNNHTYNNISMQLLQSYNNIYDEISPGEIGILRAVSNKIFGDALMFEDSRCTCEANDMYRQAIKFLKCNSLKISNAYLVNMYRAYEQIFKDTRYKRELSSLLGRYRSLG